MHHNLAYLTSTTAVSPAAANVAKALASLEVEYEHRTKVMHADVLSESIDEAFWNLPSETLTSINDRWIRVLDLMVKGDGDNENIETHRGKNNVVDLIKSLSDEEKADLHEDADSDTESDFIMVNGYDSDDDDYVMIQYGDDYAEEEEDDNDDE